MQKTAHEDVQYYAERVAGWVQAFLPGHETLTLTRRGRTHTHPQPCPGSDFCVAHALHNGVQVIVAELVRLKAAGCVDCARHHSGWDGGKAACGCAGSDDGPHADDCRCGCHAR